MFRENNFLCTVVFGVAVPDGGMKCFADAYKHFLDHNLLLSP